MPEPSNPLHEYLLKNEEYQGKSPVFPCNMKFEHSSVRQTDPGKHSCPIGHVYFRVFLGLKGVRKSVPVRHSGSGSTFLIT